MRTRDWRRAQREKRVSPARSYVEQRFAEQRRNVLLGDRWSKAGQREYRRMLSLYLRGEGRLYRSLGGTRHCRCSWCMGRRTYAVDRKHEAMAYDLREGFWEEYAEWDEGVFDYHQSDHWQEWAYFCDYHFEWGYYDFNDPLLKRVADFSCVPQVKHEQHRNRRQIGTA